MLKHVVLEAYTWVQMAAGNFTSYRTNLGNILLLSITKINNICHVEYLEVLAGELLK